MLERFTAPQELAEMKRQGCFEEVVVRFENGCGEALLGKLVEARKWPPMVHPDGFIEFHASDTVGVYTVPIVLVAEGDTWFLRK